jgi:hypothetical protein
VIFSVWTRPYTQSVAACRFAPVGRILRPWVLNHANPSMAVRIRASAEKAKYARQEADRLACVAWNQRMLGYKGPAQPLAML